MVLPNASQRRSRSVQAARRGAAARGAEAFARELGTSGEPEPELEAEICACVTRLAATLKPEYAKALAEIDIQGRAVKERTGALSS